MTACPLRPGVNFTNILQAAFTLADPKSAEKTVKLSSFFCAFGICERKICSQRYFKNLNWLKLEAKSSLFKGEVRRFVCVDDVTCHQFHQYFTCSFCANFLLPKNTILGQFHQRSTSSFYVHRSQKHKKRLSS